MSLDFEYGINTGNRFLQFVDHDEEPEDFIAAQSREEEKQQKSSSKDVKQTTKKVVTKTSTTTAASTKTNKENLTSKTTNVDQRRQQSATTSAVFSDNNQQARGDSGRGSRGGSRRGGPPYEGAGRGRSQRFNKFEGQGTSNETSSFEQAGEGWTTEGGSRGGRGRGGQRGGNFEGGRGFVNRGRGRGGRGNFNNRTDDVPQQDDNNTWQQASESNFDQNVSPTEGQFEADNNRRGNRGTHRGRPYRNYSGRDAEGQEDYRANRRQFDRQPRTFVSGVKPIEKKDGEGAHNWGNPTENPEEHPISDEITEATVPSTSAGKGWAEQVDEAEKQMTLDEYKKQIEEKKRAQQEKLPQFKRRTAGEGEDPKQWQKFEQEYRKKNAGEDDEEEDDEEVDEENESGEEYEEEQGGKKKNLITIPLRFKPIDTQRGSRGGQRRGTSRYQSNRDDQQRSTSPNQGQQQSPSSQQYDDQQRSYRGGRGTGDQRRSTRGGYRQGRSNADPNAPALDNPEDFPTLPKN